MPSKLLVLFFLLMLASMNAFAEVYKWTDDKGGIQYTQTPPMDRPSQLISSKSLQPSVAPAPPVEPLPSESNKVEVKDLKNKDQEIEVMDTDKLKKYCADQQKNLELLMDTKRISIMEDGKATNISEADKEAKIKQIQENLNKFCQ
jgi:hypothetical protein